MTKNLLPNELGVLTVGSDTAPFGIGLPPKVSKIGINTYCPNECITKVFF
jgi:hypothetical protein